jgi:hypothetical protein
VQSRSLSSLAVAQSCEAPLEESDGRSKTHTHTHTLIHTHRVTKVYLVSMMSPNQQMFTPHCPCNSICNEGAKKRFGIPCRWVRASIRVGRHLVWFHKPTNSLQKTTRVYFSSNESQSAFTPNGFGPYKGSRSYRGDATRRASVNSLRSRNCSNARTWSEAI